MVPVVPQRVPVAKPLENEDVKLLKRFVPHGAFKVRTTHNSVGSMELREFAVPSPTTADPLHFVWKSESDMLHLERISAMEAETLRQVRRAMTRLGKDLSVADLEKLSLEEKAVLALPNSRWDAAVEKAAAQGAGTNVFAILGYPNVGDARLQASILEPALVRAAKRGGPATLAGGLPKAPDEQPKITATSSSTPPFEETDAAA
jgi:hypothetical protein